MDVMKHDIQDNEIRIISSDSCSPEPPVDPGKKHKWLWITAIVVAAIAIGVVCYVLLKDRDNTESEDLELVVGDEEVEVCADLVDDDEALLDAPVSAGYVAISDTVVGKTPLTIFKPMNLTPELQIGVEALNDATVKFVVQAADVRGDNGGIVGAYVKKGELLSKGKAKSGFCAIIGDKMIVGVADATPYLEQALETGGYFFRQYPLVVAGQIVENKPKGKSLRKALAELNGEPVVVMSKKELTFHDFSRSLADLGVTNAIYLVGGKSYGYAIGRDGTRTEYGVMNDDNPANTNYIVWR